MKRTAGFVFLTATVLTVRGGEPLITGSGELPALPDGAFTLVVIPDTQHYTGRGCKGSLASDEPVENAHLAAQIEWILANRKRENIVFVTHVGDIVEKNRPEEWAVAKQHLDRLRGVLPFGLTPGNHDLEGDGDARLFQEHFPAEGFAGESWYRSSYGHDRPDQQVSADNVNSAQRFSAGGIEFLHLNLECNAPDDVLVWADSMMKAHPDCRVLVTTHMDLGIIDKPKSTAGYIEDPKGRMRWIKVHGSRGNSGEALWEKLFRRQANLDFIFCGDQSRVTALRVDATADDGHVVTSLLSDYMSEPVLRLMRFNPDNHTMEAITWHVTGGFLVESTPYVKDRSRHQFEIDWPVRP
ncbi:MAG: metallophosphoesterase [Verrucomicrobiae bacterium]|nr:metallophosphoesterase [Verrucomicrobiae bacterium]